MAVSRFCACVWTVAGLLLALLQCHSWASPLPVPSHCNKWSQLSTHTKELQNKLKDCQDCNSMQIDRKCKCLNLNASENCVFPGYLLSGLEAMNHTLPEGSFNIYSVIDKLNRTHLECKITVNPQNLGCKNSISPNSFLENLTNVVQQIQSRQTK